MACRDARPGGSWDSHELYSTVEMKQSSDSTAGRARTFWTRQKEASVGESVNVSGFVFPLRPWPVPPF